MAVDACLTGSDDQSVAVFHQHLAEITKPDLATASLAVEPRIGIAGTCMRDATSLAVKVDLDVAAAAEGKLSGDGASSLVVLGLKLFMDPSAATHQALLGVAPGQISPRLDQRAVDREVVAGEN